MNYFRMAKTLNRILEGSSISVSVKLEEAVEEYKIFKEHHLYEVLQREINGARKNQSISYKEIAQILKRPIEEINMLERDIGNMDIEILKEILDVLGLEMKIIVDLDL